MPYYRWRGVNLSASYCSGRLFAQNVQELEQLLLRKDIALIRIRSNRFQVPTPISHSQLIDFFKHIAVLLQSGILLPHAITIVAEQSAHKRLQSVLFDIVNAVNGGLAFSRALETHGALFSPVMIRMILVGEQSGCVASAVEALVVHLEMAKTFKKKIKSAAMMPCITLGAFFVIAIGVIVGIVPRFAQLFSSMGKQLPEVTQYLIYASDMLQTSFFWVLCMGGVGSAFVVYRLFRHRFKPHIDRLMLKLPVIRVVVVDSAILYWLHALSMLLKSRVPLVPALEIVHPLVQNHYLKHAFATIATDVAAGNTLRSAMINVHTQPFNPDILALMQVGQESGTLDCMVEKAAAVYHDRVDRVLRFCTFVIQPLLLILMGLLVAFLVFALYMPIFNLAQIG